MSKYVTKKDFEDFMKVMLQKFDQMNKGKKLGLIKQERKEKYGLKLLGLIKQSH